MTTSRNKSETAFHSTENEPDLRTRATFEIVLTKATNAETRMEVWFPEAIADAIDCSCHVAPPGSWELPDVASK